VALTPDDLAIARMELVLRDEREVLRIESIVRRTVPCLTADLTAQLAELTRRLERLEDKQ
jgi:hypothetical protein